MTPTELILTIIAALGWAVFIAQNLAFRKAQHNIHDLIQLLRGMLDGSFDGLILQSEAEVREAIAEMQREQGQ